MMIHASYEEYAKSPKLRNILKETAKFISKTYEILLNENEKDAYIFIKCLRMWIEEKSIWEEAEKKRIIN